MAFHLNLSFLAPTMKLDACCKWDAPHQTLLSLFQSKVHSGSGDEVRTDISIPALISTVRNPRKKLGAFRNNSLSLSMAIRSPHSLEIAGVHWAYNAIPQRYDRTTAYFRTNRMLFYFKQEFCSSYPLYSTHIKGHTLFLCCGANPLKTPHLDMKNNHFKTSPLNKPPCN